MPRPHRALLPASLLATLILPCGGCCALAGMFCGPDRSHWIAPDFETPAAAVATFREALRREHGPVLFESLSEGFKQRTGVAGSIEFALLLRELKKEVPHVHLLGDAEVEPFVALGTDRQTTTLVRSGYRVRLELVRQRYHEARYLVDGDVRSPGSYVRTLEPLVAIERDDLGMATLRVQVPDTSVPEGLTADDLVWAGVGAKWKIDRIEPDAAGAAPGSGP